MSNEVIITFICNVDSNGIEYTDLVFVLSTVLVLLAPSLALERIFQASEEIVLAMAGFDQQWQRQNLLSRRCFLMAKRDPPPKMCEQVRSLLIHLTRLLVIWMGGVGHRARVSKAQRAKSRGSKNFQLEVGAQRVPRLVFFKFSHLVGGLPDSSLPWSLFSMCRLWRRFRHYIACPTLCWWDSSHVGHWNLTLHKWLLWTFIGTRVKDWTGN